jgi:hypothetical protein
MAVFTLGPLIVLGNLTGWLAGMARWMATVSPVSALLPLTGSQVAAGDLGIQTGWIEFCIVSGLMTALFAFITVRELDPLLLDRPRPTGKVVKVDAGQSGLFRRLFYLVDPNRPKALVPNWLNPIMVKEFRTRKFGRLHWLIRLVLACSVLSLLLTVLAATGTVSWGVEKIAGPMVLMQLALLLLVGPSLGANLIASEVESGGWQLLRVTPVSPLKVVSGKLMSVVWTMLLVLLATLPGYAVMSVIQPSMSNQVVNVLFSLLWAAAMVVAISACVSSFCRSTAVATATSYGLLLAIFVGTLLVWLAQGKPFGPMFVERVLMFNPAATALSEVRAAGFEQYSLAPVSWWVAGSVSSVCIVVLAVRLWKMTLPD